jgi:hypothetical protein
MSKDLKNFNPQSSSVTAFLAGVTFTAMILLFDKSESMTFMIPYVSLPLVSVLIPLTAIVSFLFILGTLATLRQPVDGGSVHKKFYNMTLFYISAGFIGLLIIIPLVIVNYTWIGAFVVGIVEIITAVPFIREASRLPKLW